MVTSDFAYIIFKEHLGDDAGDIDTSFPFVGSQSSVKSFTISGYPINGYVIVNLEDMQNNLHAVKINGRNLPGLDLINVDPKDRLLRLNMDEIPEGFLKNGTNTIQILLGASEGAEVESHIFDNFLIHDAVIHWRETDKPREKSY
jgi:hypothetical protein